MSPIKRILSEKFDDEDCDDVIRLSPKRLRGGGFDDDFGSDDVEDNNLFDNDELVISNDMEQYIPQEALEEAAKALSGTDQQRWKRPDLPLDRTTNAINLDMLWIDMDVASGEPLKHNPNITRKEVVGSSGSKVPILRTYGVTDDGFSVAAFIHGFTPYGYFSLPPGYILSGLNTNVPKIREALNTRLLQERSANGLTEAVLGVSYVTHLKSMYGYDNPDTKFLKVYVSLPGLVPALKRIMEDGISLPGVVRENKVSDSNTSSQLEYAAFECNVPFVLRFMVDCKLAGAGWLTFPENTYEIRPAEKKETHCQVCC